MDSLLRDFARRAVGFMPEPEGLALYQAGLRAASLGPLLEIGSYCGKSATYLGAAARERSQVLFTIDHHRGSEEHQPGEEYHDPRLTDPRTGHVDTLPHLAATIRRAGLERHVLAIAAVSAELAAVWREPIALVFIDGGHAAATARADLEGWVPHLIPGGLLAIHDVFPDPAQGGRPPFEILQAALASGMFTPVDEEGSLRVLVKRGEAGSRSGAGMGSAVTPVD